MFGIVLNDEGYESWYNWELGFMMGWGLRCMILCMNDIRW